jgi:hypothetical protein
VEAARMTVIMMRAISWHDTKLRRKALGSLNCHAVKRQTLAHCEKIVKHRRERALKSQHLKMMRRRFRRQQRVRQLDRVAKDYFAQHRRLMVLRYWRRHAKQMKKLLTTMSAALEHNSLATTILLERFLHDQYCPRQTGSVQAVVRLHYFVVKHLVGSRVKRKNLPRFSAAIEQALKYKLGLIFTAMRRNVFSLKAFKLRQRRKEKSKVFEVLKQMRIEKRKLLFLHLRYQ